MSLRSSGTGPGSSAPGGEHSEWLNGLARGLIERAARPAPSSLCARLEEEWLAELAARSGGLWRLRFATGCYWASRVISLARVGREVPPRSPPAVQSNGRALAVWLDGHSRLLSRRVVIL